MLKSARVRRAGRNPTRKSKEMGNQEESRVRNTEHPANNDILVSSHLVSLKSNEV